MFIQKSFRGTNELHWYILTVVLVFIAMLVVGQIPLTGALFYFGFQNGLDMQEILTHVGENDFSALGIDLNLFLFLVLLSFAFALWVLRGCIKRFHHKTIADVSTGRPSWDWKRIWFGFGSWAALLIATQAISYFMDPDNHVLQFELSKFLPLLIIALVMLPLQTTFEELLNRGYLMQGLALGLGNRWMPLIITSLFFGGLHMMNPEVMEYGWPIMLVNYAGTGLLLGMLTLMDDGLELAIGMHAANNIFAALFVTFEDSALQTYAIFSLKELEIYSATVGGLVISVIYFFICKWKYGWIDWSRLYRKIERPLNVDHQPSTDLPV